MERDYFTALDVLIRELLVIQRTGSATSVGEDPAWSPEKRKTYVQEGSPLQKAVRGVEVHHGGMLPWPIPRLAWMCLYNACTTSKLLWLPTRMLDAWDAAGEMVQWAVDKKQRETFHSNRFRPTSSFSWNVIAKFMKLASPVERGKQ